MNSSVFSEACTRVACAAPALRDIAADFAEQDWAVKGNFLDGQRWREMATEARQLWDQGSFRKAGVGQRSAQRLQEDIRGDYSLWLDAQQTPVACRFAAEELEALRAALNKGLYLGLFEFEGQLAVYPPGASYQRHVDQLRGSAARRVSVVFYLNDGWQMADGGELCLYPPDFASHADRCVTVPPVGGTLAVFGSAAMPHEVRPANRPRFSLSGWFRCRA